MSTRLSHYYVLYISRFFKTDLHLFELSVWLLAFGQALILVFIPIILYTLGLSLRQIIIFLLILTVIDVPLNLVAAKVIEKRGALFAVIVSVFARIGSLIVLYNLKNSWAEIILLAFLWAVFDSFYWVGHLYIFSRASHKNNTRFEVSIIQETRILGVIVAPIMGAFILLNFDQKTLIFFSVIAICFSLLPLFKMRHMKFEPDKKIMPFWEFFKDPIERRHYLFTSLSAIREEVETILWPFFIFFIFRSIKTVAYIPTLVAIASLFFIYIAGKLSYKKNINKMVAIGALGAGLVWLARLAYFHNQTFVLASVFVISLLAILVDIPVEISIFNRSRLTEPLAAVTYLNLFRMLARAILYLLLLILPTTFSSSFMIAILAMALLFAVSLRAPKFLLKS